MDGSTKIAEIQEWLEILLKEFSTGNLATSYTHYNGLLQIIREKDLPIPEDQLNYLVDVLVYDGYVRKIENYNGQGYDVFSATIEGRMIYHKGGYKALRKRKRMIFNFEQVKSWAIVIGTVLAGLYGLNQMLCNRAKASATPILTETINDSLSKYSYQILLFGTKTLQGSGFFIEKDKDLIFVTAKHVVELCKNGDNNFKLSEILIVLNFTNVIQIDPARIKVYDTCNSNLYDYDVSMLAVDRSFINKVNTVNRFLRSPVSSWSSVEIFGFPGKANRIDDMFVLTSPTHFTIDSSAFSFGIQEDQSGKADSTSIIILPKEFIDFSDMRGFSGSPVFIRDRYSSQFRLMGVFTATNFPEDTVSGLKIQRVEEFHRAAVN